MVHRQYDKIDQYEKEWRKKHKIKDGYPSTLVESEIKNFENKKKIFSTIKIISNERSRYYRPRHR